MTNDKKIPYFFLSDKEEQIMNVLWQTDKALKGSEILGTLPPEKERGWANSSISALLTSLLKKKAIVKKGFAQSTTSYGRTFRPTLTKNEYAVMQFTRFYDEEQSPVSATKLLSAFVTKEGNPQDLVKELKTLLDDIED